MTHAFYTWDLTEHTAMGSLRQLTLGSGFDAAQQPCHSLTMPTSSAFSPGIGMGTRPSHSDCEAKLDSHSQKPTAQRGAHSR